MFHDKTAAMKKEGRRKHKIRRMNFVRPPSWRATFVSPKSDEGGSEAKPALARHSKAALARRSEAKAAPSKVSAVFRRKYLIRRISALKCALFKKIKTN